MLDNLRASAAKLKREVVAVWVAARDERTPWAARLVAALTAAYALSPIDLIPDFIPILGLLDDLLLVPIGLWLAIRLIPDTVMADARRAAAQMASKPRSAVGAIIVASIWAVGLLLIAVWLGWIAA